MTDNAVSSGVKIDLVLGRYEIENCPKVPNHKSPISTVYFATYIQVNNTDEHHHFAIKFFHNKDSFERELMCRLPSRDSFKDGEDLFIQDKKKRLNK